MSKQLQINFAKLHYPHLSLGYAVACIRVSLENFNIIYEEFSLDYL